MEATEIATIVAASAAAVSAIAASRSASASARGVAAAQAPYVWPSFGIRTYDGPMHPVHSVALRLHNDGAGVAFDVRFSLEPSMPEVRYVPPPIPAMRSGEVVPQQDDAEAKGFGDDATFELPLNAKLGEHDWSIVIRYSDALGRPWQVIASLDLEVPRPARRMRRRRAELWRPRVDW